MMMLMMSFSASVVFLVAVCQSALVSGASSDVSLSETARDQSTRTRQKRDDSNLFVTTQAERIEFLSAHNTFRNDFTAPGNPQPEAGGMPRMYWSALLEASAIDWAGQCHTDLKHGQTGVVSEAQFLNLTKRWGTWIGQNLYRSSAKPKPWNMVYAFANETYFYTYKSGTGGTCGKVCGHFTQIVWENTFLVGCGSVKCGDVWIGACNYLPGGNYQGAQPYTAGSSCSLCSSTKLNFTQCEGRLCVPKDRCSPVKECSVIDNDNCLCSEAKYNEIVTVLMQSAAINIRPTFAGVILMTLLVVSVLNA